jgi:hypothetical protein
MNNEFSKSTQDNDESLSSSSSSSSEQARQRRERMVMRQEQWQQQQRQLLMVMMRNSSHDPARHSAVTPIQPLDVVPYNSFERMALLRSPLMRYNATTATTTNSNTPTLNREEFVHILDCALDICDEVIHHMNRSSTRPDNNCD